MNQPVKPLSSHEIDQLFKNAVAAYQGKDYIQARELLEIIVSQDPLYMADDRRASDLLSDVEFQLAEKKSARRKNRILGILSIGLGAITLLLIILTTIGWGRAVRLQASNASANATLNAQTGLLYQAYTTVTAASEKAASAQSTMITMRQDPGSAQATIQAYEALLAAQNFSGQPAFGPLSGDLKHEQSDYVISLDTGVNLKNMIIEATFYNPYSPSENTWDYGYFFRDTGGDHQYRITVDSDSSWTFDYVEDPYWETLDSGTLTNLRTAEDENNTLKLVVVDDRTLFYVNNEFISALPTSAKIVPGDVYIVTAAFDGHEIIGRNTRFADLTIWPLP